MSDANDFKTLKTRPTSQGNGGAGLNAGDVDRAVADPPTDKGLPLMGLFALGFAVMGIFTYGPVFVPLGLIFGVIALLMGQIGTGISALLLSVVGVLTSPTLMIMLGLGALGAWFGL